MRVKLEQWGKALAVRVPKRALREAKLSEGDAIDLAVTARGVISLRALKKRLTLKSLLEGITSEDCHGETGWGGPVGKEVW
jgi:antitoxin MazE